MIACVKPAWARIWRILAHYATRAVLSSGSIRGW